MKKDEKRKAKEMEKNRKKKDEKRKGNWRGGGKADEGRKRWKSGEVGSKYDPIETPGRGGKDSLGLRDGLRNGLGSDEH